MLEFFYNLGKALEVFIAHEFCAKMRKKPMELLVSLKATSDLHPSRMQKLFAVGD